MVETLRKLIENSNDLYVFKIEKNDTYDRKTWSFRIDDKRLDEYGLKDKLSNYKHEIVTLRRGDHFFLSYKFSLPDRNIYFVDIRKANHKTSVSKYIDGVVKFYMESNDISIRKNESSFKISKTKMMSLGIDNYLDLCYYFRKFSAVGIGLTRDVRNLIVLDIDVDCRIKENKDELNSILLLFAGYGMLPNFEIHNNENGHVQLQWLIQSYPYKTKCTEQIKEIISRLETEKNRNCEVKKMSQSVFLMDTEGSVDYRVLTKSFTDISDKPNFGDKNFTFWKAKNFCTAMFHMQNLELKMPYYDNGEISYIPEDKIVNMFSDKEKRAEYFSKAPEFDDINKRSNTFLLKYKEKEILNDKMSEDDMDEENTFEEDCNGVVYGEENSRNNFVFHHTRIITWQICRERKFKTRDDIEKLSKSEYKKFMKSVYEIVRNEFNRKDDEYGGGKWPGTSNGMVFSKKEFDSAFNTAFDFAILKFKNTSKYSDEQRDNSIKKRSLKKDMRLIVVDYIRQRNSGVRRNELLETVNKALEKSGEKKISFSSLKRYIDISKKMDETDRRKLYGSFYEKLDTQKNNNYISINIIEEIIKNIE